MLDFFAIGTLLLVTAIASCSRSAALKLTPCTGPGLESEARCATYEVFEDRAAARGRWIPLRVLVLPATGTPVAADPLVFFAGGPGDGIIESAPHAAHTYAEVRAHRDLVFVDLRGTGESAALSCPELMRSQGFLDDFLPLDGVRSCRQRLAQHADLGQYNTANAVDDLAEVLTALGYQLVNVHGASYGTRSAMELVRRHPERVRTATLIGVVPPDSRNPLTFARDAQAALDATFAECAADPACAAAFPDSRGELASVLARVERQPVTVEVMPPGATAPLLLRLDRAGVAQTVRYMLYQSSAAAELPLAIHSAAVGEFRPLAEMAALFAGEATQTADGLFLSVLCAEDQPFIDEGEVAAAVAGTFLGDFRVRAQERACAAWDVPPIAATKLESVSSPVPALVISGERDPVTPARWGDQVSRTLPNARHLVVPAKGCTRAAGYGAPKGSAKAGILPAIRLGVSRLVPPPQMVHGVHP